MSLKLNMSKAYDRVEWDYLECILKVLGFPNRIITLIMQCVKTTSFSVLINGRPKWPIVPSRGLRQRDPLSPYVFLLYTEGLANLLNHVMLDKSLLGIRICRGAPTINHLLFVVCWWQPYFLYDKCFDFKQRLEYFAWVCPSFKSVYHYWEQWWFLAGMWEKMIRLILQQCGVVKIPNNMRDT